MPRKAPLAQRLRQLAEAVESMEEYAGDEGAWLTSHEETRKLIESRRVDREQLNYSVPEALALKQRVNAYNAEHGNPGAGNLVAAILDSWLRAHGYPPDLGNLKS